MSIRGWRGISTAGAAALGGGAPGGGSSGRRHCGRLAGDYGVREMEGGGRSPVIHTCLSESCKLNGELKGDPIGWTAV